MCLRWSAVCSHTHQNHMQNHLVWLDQTGLNCWSSYETQTMCTHVQRCICSFWLVIILYVDKYWHEQTMTKRPRMWETRSIDTLARHPTTSIMFEKSPTHRRLEIRPCSGAKIVVCVCVYVFSNMFEHKQNKQLILWAHRLASSSSPLFDVSMVTNARQTEGRLCCRHWSTMKKGPKKSIYRISLV